MVRIYTRPSVDGPLGHACRVNKIVPGLAKACRVAETSRQPDPILNLRFRQEAVRKRFRPPGLCHVATTTRVVCREADMNP